MLSKTQLRQHIFQLRQQLNQDAQAQKSAEISLHLLRHPWFDLSQHIACYLAFKGEVATGEIIQTLWQKKKSCYLPIVDAEHFQLAFALYNSETQMEKNRYGIEQPVYEPEAIILPIELDVVIMPLVGFDKRGNRLGMGAGFYDRSLAFKSQQTKPLKPRLIGLAYDFQRVDELPVQAWDVKLDAVVTESGWQIFKH